MAEDNQLRVAVFGAGSIGCYVGGYLQHAGANVSYIGRDRFALMIREYGLTLTHYERGPISLMAEDCDFHTQPHHIKMADVILVTVKSQDTEAAGKALAWHAKEGALIISLQNGVRNADVLRGQLLEHTVLAGMVSFNVTAAGPAVFHSGTEGGLVIEAHPDPRLEALTDLFTDAGMPVETHANMTGISWGKLLINLSNAVNTLHGDTLLTGLAQREYRRALAASIEEGLELCKRAGIEPIPSGAANLETMIKTLRLPNMLYTPIMKKMIKIDAAARSSMLDDLEMGRPPEVDYLQGEIVRLAESLRQGAPVNAAILKATNEAFAAGQSPRLTGREIYALTKTPSKPEA